MKLRISQKNELFDIIEQNELSPSLFSFEEKLNPSKDLLELSKVKVNRLDYFFQLAKFNSGCYATMCPFEDSFSVQRVVTSWETVITLFKEWMSIVRIELNIDDKWARLNSAISEIDFENSTANTDNSKFTAQEYIEVKEKIELLKQRISALDMLPEQLSVINNKLDGIAEQAVHLGKFDWNSLLIGTVVTVAIQVGLPPEISKYIFVLIKNIFTSLLLGNNG